MMRKHRRKLGDLINKKPPKLDMEIKRKTNYLLLYRHLLLWKYLLFCIYLFCRG